MVDKITSRIICINSGKGKMHDFKLFKESKTHITEEVTVVVDSGYQGLQEFHANTELPKKRSKKNPLTKQDKLRNKEISSKRVLNENVIGVIKRFRIIAEKYRNHRKRFNLRFSLLSGIYNFELRLG